MLGVSWTYRIIRSLLQTFCPHLGSFFFMLFLLSLRFGQISPLAFFRWFLPRPRIGMLILVTVSPVITAFHSCCLWHHVFDQVNLWLAWVGFETGIFWQCSPGTVETQRLYPLRHGPYSPGIALFDYHFFRSMIYSLGEQFFHSYEDAKK